MIVRLELEIQRHEIQVRGRKDFDLFKSLNLMPCLWKGSLFTKLRSQNSDGKDMSRGNSDQMLPRARLFAGSRPAAGEACCRGCERDNDSPYLVSYLHILYILKAGGTGTYQYIVIRVS